MIIDISTLLIAVMGGGVLSSIATELLKHPLVPIAFERFPRITAYVLSAITSVIAIVNQGVTLAGVTSNWLNVVLLGATTMIASSVAYKSFVKQSSTTRF